MNAVHCFDVPRSLGFLIMMYKSRSQGMKIWTRYKLCTVDLTLEELMTCENVLTLFLCLPVFADAVIHFLVPLRFRQNSLSSWPHFSCV